ncbi:hypothetical protein P8452_53965 [Trifolium repens]|nr:hypothetical protein P8452_53965 [Trifolium repens]
MGDDIEITTEEQPLLPNPPVSEPNPAEKTTYLVLITIQHIAILGTFLTVEGVRAYKEFVDYHHARGMLYGLIYILEVCSIVAFLRFLCFARAHSHVLEFIFTVGVNLICSTMMINIINSKLWIGNLVVWSIALLIGIIYFSVKSCKQGGCCGRRTCCGCCGRRTCCGCCGRRNSNVNENDVGGGDVAVVVSGSCCEMSSCCTHRTSDGDISCCDVFSCCAPRRTGSDNTDGGGVSDGSCRCDVFSCCAPRTGSDKVVFLIDCAAVTCLVVALRGPVATTPMEVVFMMDCAAVTCLVVALRGPVATTPMEVVFMIINMDSWNY